MGMGTWGMGFKGVWATWATRSNGMGTGVWATWAMGPMGDLLPKYQKDVKFSKRCQVVKKMSNVKKLKHLDYGGGSQKN